MKCGDGVWGWEGVTSKEQDDQLNIKQASVGMKCGIEVWEGVGGWEALEWGVRMVRGTGKKGWIG